MGYKCAIQLKGLVRGEPKPGKKFRANGLKIAAEMGSERHSKSKTLDKSRSKDNTYINFCEGSNDVTVGADVWAKICEEADNYRIELPEMKIKRKRKLRNGETIEEEYTQPKTSRKLRSDTVIGVAMIINPPAEMTYNWSEDDYNRFFNDSLRVLYDLYDIFSPDNIRFIAVHRDEAKQKDKSGCYSRHAHILSSAKDSEGHYCGNYIDAETVHNIHCEYPARMRALGWDLDDLDVADWERMKTDPEYAEERKAKNNKSGLDVNEYDLQQREKRVKKREENVTEREKIVTENEIASQKRIEASESEAKQKHDKIIAEANETAQNTLNAAQNQADDIIANARLQAAAIMAEVDAVKKNLDEEIEKRATEKAAIKFDRLKDKYDIGSTIQEPSETPKRGRSFGYETR